MINHKQIYKNGVFGGILNTTLCGKLNNYQNEKNKGMNVSTDFNCKLCLKIALTVWGKKIVKNSVDLKLVDNLPIGQKI